MAAHAEDHDAAAGEGAEADAPADVPDVDAAAAAEAAQEQANELRQRQSASSPHEFVTMEKIIRTGPFTEMIVTIPLILALTIALVIDAPRSCTADPVVGADASSAASVSASSSAVHTYGKAPPLKAWAITNVVLNCLMFSINALATRIYVKNPSVLSNGGCRWNMAIMLSRMLDFGWFIWFIVGAVWTFKIAKHPCHYEIPFVYHVSMAIVIFGFTVLAMGLLACCVVCVLLALGLGAMLRLRRLEQGAGNGGDGDGDAGGATEAQIAALPCRTFHEGMIDAAEATCSICFGDYIPGEDVRFLPCHHHFHAACVDTWLAGSNVCPICKHPVGEPAPETGYNPAPDDRAPTGTSSSAAAGTTGAGTLAALDTGSAAVLDSGVAASTTTTTTTTGAAHGADLLDEEGAPFARAPSAGPGANMGTFVDLPK